MTEELKPIPKKPPRAHKGVGLTLIIISAIVIASAAMFATAIFRQEREEIHQSRQETMYSPALQTLRTGQTLRLEAPPHWEVRVEGERSLAIPVDLAIEAVIREAREGAGER